MAYNTQDRETEKKGKYLVGLDRYTKLCLLFHGSNEKSSLNTHSNELSLATKTSWATGISCYAPTKKGKEKSLNVSQLRARRLSTSVLSVCLQQIG